MIQKDALLKRFSRRSHRKSKDEETPEDNLEHQQERQESDQVRDSTRYSTGSCQGSNYFAPKNLAELNAILDNKGEEELVLIDFFATWCPPCKRIAPVFHHLAKEHSRITFITVDVDKIEEAMTKMNVEAMPTFVAFKGNTEVCRIVGADKTKLSLIVHRLEA